MVFTIGKYLGEHASSRIGLWAVLRYRKKVMRSADHLTITFRAVSAMGDVQQSGLITVEKP